MKKEISMFSRNRRQRRGFSLIELLIVIAIILIIITIAVPKYNRTQMYMRETAAIKAIQTIHTVQVQYQSQFGRYATTLAELGPPASGAPGPGSSDLIGNDLAGGTKQGYKFSLSAVPVGYQINANPETYGSSGSKSFFSDQSMVIRENDGPEPATVNSREYGMVAK
jgi:prepilin-type N-terminal cleavage/methylation domain-containing protein